MRRRPFLLAGLLGLGASACTPGIGTTSGASDGGAAGFPLELANCEASISLDAPAQRIVLLESAPVTILDGLGALDRVVARAGTFPGGYYSPELAARIEEIPTLSEDLDASGHLQISQEVVIAQRPDLVMGLPDGITRAGMRDAGAEVMVQNVYCGDAERASFADLDAQIAVIGQVLGLDAEAAALTAELGERVAAVEQTAGTGTKRTAAALYPSIGGGPLYAYGAASMVTAQFDALGLENVFADTPDRVFEVGSEPLLAADPDLLIVLHQAEDGEAVLAEMIASDQLGSLRAVREESLLPLLFNFCEPASPLVVDGLEQIRDHLEAQG